MTEFTDEYLDQIRDQVDAYNQLEILIRDGIIDKVELDKFDGTSVLMPLVQMYRRGYLNPRDSNNHLFPMKSNGEYVVYNIIKDSRLIVKGYVTIESYEYETQEFSEARAALAEREKERIEAARARAAKAMSPSTLSGMSSKAARMIEEELMGLSRKEIPKRRLKRVFKWS